MLVLVVDIQSDIVEGSIVEFPEKSTPKHPVPDQTPRLLYSCFVRIPLKSHADGDYITTMMLRAVEDLSLHVAKEAPQIVQKPIEAVHYILSSPWVISHSKTVHTEFKKDTEVTEAMIRHILDEDRRALVSKYEPDMIFIEQKMFSVELNGYSVEKYAGKKAKTLKVSFAFTLSSDQLIKKIQAAFSRHVHSGREFFHSAILLQYISSRARSSTGEEYIVLHVHGELTDIIIVKNGFSSYLASFPFGTSSLVRRATVSLQSGFEAALSTLVLSLEGKMDEIHQRKIESVLAPIVKIWQADCTRAFNGIGEEVRPPRVVHMYIESPLTPLFKKALEGLNYDVRLHEGSLRDVHSFALKDVI